MKKKVKGKSARALAILLSAVMAAGTACMPVLGAQTSDGAMQVEFSMDEEGIGEFPMEEPPEEELPMEEVPMEEDAGSDFAAQEASYGSAEQDAQGTQQDPQENVNESGEDAQALFDAGQGAQEDAAQEGQADSAREDQNVPSQEGQAEAGQESQDDDAQPDQAETGQDAPPASEEENFAVQEGQDSQDPVEKAGQPETEQDAQFEFEAGQDAQGDAGQAEQDEAEQADQDEAAQADQDEAAQADQNDAGQENPSALEGEDFAEQEDQGDAGQDAPGEGSSSGNEPVKEEQPEDPVPVEDVMEETAEEEGVAEQAQDGVLTSNGGTITLAVGESRNIYLSIPSKEALLSAMWSSNSGNLSINSYGGRSTMCTIKAVSYTSSPLIVDCTYHTQYLDSMNYMRTKTNYASYTIYITQGSGGGGSSTGSYTISSSASTINLDRSGNPYTSLVLTCGTNLSDTVYITDNSSNGNCVSASLNRTEGNKAYYIIDSYATGSQTIKFDLIYKKDAYNTSIKASVTVRVNVTCSHYYDNGVVTKEPTATSSGTKAYTCRNCGHQKTETIPATGNGSSISKCDISLSATSYTYSGSACKPSVTVKQGSKTLKSGTDYTVSYKNNVNAGTATVTITGNGSYSGSVSKTFTIKKAEQNLRVSAPSTTLKPGETMQLTVSGTGSITYASSNASIAAVSSSGLVTGKKAGTATITVNAAGNTNYNSTKKTVSITVTTAKTASVTFSDSSVSLKKGNRKVVTASATGDGVPDTFYFSCSRSDNSVISTEWTGAWKNGSGIYSHDIAVNGLKAGTATLTVYLKDADTDQTVASGTISINVTAPAASSNTITADCVKLSATSYTYNGSAKKPSVTVKVGGKTLKKGTHYTLTYKNNRNAGTASVTVKGKGQYKGTVKKTFTIKKASQNFLLLLSSFTFSHSRLKKNALNVPIYAFRYVGTLSAKTSSKYITISKGKVYVKKGTPKGTYKLTVRASGNANYQAKELTITVKVK